MNPTKLNLLLISGLELMPVQSGQDLRLNTSRVSLVVTRVYPSLSYPTLINENQEKSSWVLDNKKSLLKSFEHYTQSALLGETICSFSVSSSSWKNVNFNFCQYSTPYQYYIHTWETHSNIISSVSILKKPAQTSSVYSYILGKLARLKGL